ncbi:MAG: hypothetical protein A2836_03735 [Candidatus Taylorbacteria bacterium RIFCSPHIGHO2_01_FULL_45_63]|uniref:Uncharacterized protein n=1 Tax=Candidatus Taylorbacteria bacterium RIFCSPHIGHO2_02_FULL_45_35 TaxID=1802311 RepID=A0A1G2MSF8_9BACT|nr:MAG: hypothetical protein A2836_03735 [Candidatus Taylorbacteria bacterium RIFCSPHIGHO2_01_FULL_45_63]OHA26808.1 MAG: hypothetical protein A3D56_02665 [Candidatus Taylorbacteria bacterium RIFCSPHIGHO2_02_FULL_45_35]OHA33631.1 MAG: hypothetical protein A3A22_03490 [Candidatus Taylorbacteria bacterium RIFCSPLOWO2_01_FULL_45_34b]
MKKPSPKKVSSSRDQYTVVLEGLRSDFKIFGESLDFVRDRVTRVESDTSIIKREVALIRHNQVTRDEFKFLESRVAALEKKVR